MLGNEPSTLVNRFPSLTSGRGLFGERSYAVSVAGNREAALVEIEDSAVLAARVGLGLDARRLVADQ